MKRNHDVKLQLVRQSELETLVRLTVILWFYFLSPRSTMGRGSDKQLGKL